MKTVMLVFGTRPEAIKMCPLVLELKKRHHIRTVVCLSGQHGEMLYSVLNVFGVVADYDMRVMKENQDLFDITSSVINNIKPILSKEKPDIVLVHGDTSTTFATSLACFYMRIPVAHVEAGLRSLDISEPFPEEFNRRVTSIVSKYDFAPTLKAKDNLLIEGKHEDQVFVTGNTVIDALNFTLSKESCSSSVEIPSGKKLVLFTAHRRESLDRGLDSIFRAISRIANERDDIHIIYPMHPNPKIRAIAEGELAKCSNIFLTEPLGVVDFHKLLSKSHFVLTDSGGLQEEATALHKPVLVLRNKSERVEGVDSGALKIIGTNEFEIYKSCLSLLDNEEEYKKMASAESPYGDGFASKRIADIIERIIE